MDIFSDPVLLSRIQFAFTAMIHFVFVPMSVGLGLIMAIHQTKAYKSGTPEDAAASKFWVRVFAVTFAIGVATGITMEFSFGTNWADYSRYVGDIFGAPLAAEALFAFFLESVFLGVLLFGKGKVKPKTEVVSAWLVFGGSALSALWILIANSWMQTPAGAELSSEGTKAILTDFFAAAANFSTGVRYAHTVLALIVMGAFFCMAVAGYYFLKNKHTDFAKKSLRTGLIVAVIATVALMVSAHSTAVEVTYEQPTKLAAMEGMYEDEVPGMYLFGWVDEENQTTSGLNIPGLTSFLASGTFDTVFPGLNSLSDSDRYGAMDPEDVPVNLVFQSYHLMVAMMGLIALVIIIAFIGLKKDNIGEKRWVARLLVISPLFPFLAIQGGWMTAEAGRQPWVVYPAASSPDGLELLTANATSTSVTAGELFTTILLFVIVYVFLLVVWARMIGKILKDGPVDTGGALDGDAVPSAVTAISAAGEAAMKAVDGSSPGGQPASAKGGE